MQTATQAEQSRTIQIDDNATATICWNEQENRFDITIHLIAENHTVEFLGHPSRGISTMDEAIAFAEGCLFASYADYHEWVAAQW
jgi:hypothetical protein